MRNTVAHIRKLRDSGEKIVMLTAYDASFAALCDAAGVDTVLVGDSLGMVVQGHDSTLPVTLEQMEYHVAMVARGSQKGLIVADMPFGSYQATKEAAFANAARLMVAGAQVVKLEGGTAMAETVHFLVERGIRCRSRCMRWAATACSATPIACCGMRAPSSRRARPCSCSRPFPPRRRSR
jgi:3-methyl-2-oxobutanoate hydroxymethyltransferase